MWIIALLIIITIFYMAMLDVAARADEEAERERQKVELRGIYVEPKRKRKHKSVGEKILENYERKKGEKWEKAKEEKDTEVKISS
jgi:hypothetical protein